MIARETRRFFRSSPLVSFTGVLLLAVGVGSSAIAVSLLQAFTSPRYPGMRAQGYATIGEGDSDELAMPISWAQFEKLRPERGGAMRMAAYSPAAEAVVVFGDTRKPVRVAAVSGGFFSGFTVPLVTGRDFNPGEAATAGQHEIILSSPLARLLFGSPNASVGQVVRLGGLPYQVTGVAPRSFSGLFGDTADAWVPANCVVPLRLNLPTGVPPDMWKYMNSFYVLLASDGLSSAGLAECAPRVLPLRAGGESALGVAQGISVDWHRDQTLRRWLRLGLGFSLALAFVSCLNVCLLLLARVPLLVEEVRLKKALGAGSRQISMELATGPAVMMLTGLLAALLLWAAVLLVLVRRSEPEAQLLFGSSSAVFMALACQILLTFAVMLVVAFLPAAMALRSGAVPRMGTTATMDRRILLLMQVPVTVQISCGIGVSILAAMIGASLLGMMRQPLGYDPTHRLVVCLVPTSGTIVFDGASGASAQFLAIQRVLEQVKALPGVRSASYVDEATFDNQKNVDEVQDEDRPSAPPISANHVLVTSGYFGTMGSRILRGRDVAEWSKAHSPREVVVSSMLAGQLFHGTDPVGRAVNVIIPARFGLQVYKYSATVVGIVEDGRAAGYGSSPQPTFYEEGHAYSDAMPHLVVYGEETAPSLEAWTKSALAQWMPAMGVMQIYSLSDKVNASLAPERNRALGAFAGSGVMASVALVGLYGSLAFYLRAKRREMAIRMSLGASPWKIRQMVLVRALRCALAAALLSLPWWFVLGRLSSGDYVGQVAWSTGRAAIITVLCVAGSVLLAMIPASAAGSISPAGILKEL